MILRVGTRASELALYQANAVATQLRAKTGIPCEIVVIRTSGDKLAEATLTQIGGKRLFVKEIEDALLRDDVDIAVHSAKDMPADLPPELAVAATLPREDPRDVFVLPEGSPGEVSILTRPGATPRIGTSSIRRVAQLRTTHPGATFLPIRGNVDTRLRKLDEGQYDALVLAAAGLRRLGFGHRISSAIPPHVCVPAPGQGIVAVEIRSADHETRRALQGIHDAAAATALDAERAVVAALGGGCQLPLGALARLDGASLQIDAIVCSADGSRVVRAHAAGPAADPRVLGEQVAQQLAQGGATAILDELRGQQGPVEGN